MFDFGSVNGNGWGLSFVVDYFYERKALIGRILEFKAECGYLGEGFGNLSKGLVLSCFLLNIVRVIIS